ncbi:hypothetical protein Tco_0921459 [Tanacetum coccineum]
MAVRRPHVDHPTSRQEGQCDHPPWLVQFGAGNVPHCQVSNGTSLTLVTVRRHRHSLVCVIRLDPTPVANVRVDARCICVFLGFKIIKALERKRSGKWQK